MVSGNMETMEYRTLDITVISAENLKDVNMISKMDEYVEVSIGGDPVGKRKTHVDKDGGKSPKWNHRLKFNVGVGVLVANPALPLLFKIRSDRPLGDKDIGDVSVPINELLLEADGGERVVEYQVRTPLGKPKGTLKFSYKLAAPTVNTGGEAVTAHPGSGAAYPPPAHVGYAQPLPGYGALPPAPGYGAPPLAAGYGYPAPGYGCRRYNRGTEPLLRLWDTDIRLRGTGTCLYRRRCISRRRSISGWLWRLGCWKGC